MTIQEYIDAVAAQLDLPERVVQRIRRDLENELFELVQAGADQQQAIEKMGPVEEAAAKLNEKVCRYPPSPEGAAGRDAAAASLVPFVLGSASRFQRGCGLDGQPFHL